MIAFVRHGQTAINRDGRLQGRLDAELSDLGRAQADAVASYFADEPVTRVISSPLVRARATAEALAARHAVPVEIDERLIELDYGEWDGVALHEIDPGAWAAWRAEPTFSPPGGESLVAVSARVASFCAEMRPGDDGVIAVSHVSPIKAAVCAALGVDERATWRMQLGLASVSRIDARPDGTSYLISFNEVGHLSALA